MSKTCAEAKRAWRAASVRQSRDPSQRNYALLISARERYDRARAEESAAQRRLTLRNTVQMAVIEEIPGLAAVTAGLLFGFWRR